MTDSDITHAIHPLSLADRPPREDRRPMILHARVIAGDSGGPDKTILRSAHYLHSSVLRMAAVYIHPPRDRAMRDIRRRARRWNCPLHHVGEVGPVDPRTVVRLLHLCKQLRVTIWHAHDHKTNALGLLLRRFWPMKLISTVHGWVDRDWRTRLYRRIDYFCLKHYDRVIAVSPPLAEDCLLHGLSPRRTLLILNGIDPHKYERPNSNTAVRLKLGIDPDAFVLGVVGRLSAEKGADRALRCLHAVRRDHPNVQLHVVGDGPEKPRLQALAGELEIQANVRWWGWRDELRPLYGAMDALLLPSFREGLPNAALEAMAMRLPVAATPVGALPDLLDQGRCGVLLDQENESVWPGMIRPLIVSRRRREEIGRRARRRIEEKYTFQRRMVKMKALYKKLLRLPDHEHAHPYRRAA